ncbi:Ladybird homeobox corepressor 1-like protein [Gryllus bimaculatus]|nr:Ladybird homeobox corepressor 1-like protein [Gryllus bimaculatus]
MGVAYMPIVGGRALRAQVGTVLLYGVPIVSLVIEAQERLCLAQISNTLLKEFSYNEIHNRRVALGITCVQCTPVQLEILRRAGAMPVSSRRCGMITRREAERLCKSFLGDNTPPRLPEDFAFSVHHECAWGCRGAFLPARDGDWCYVRVGIWSEWGFHVSLHLPLKVFIKEKNTKQNLHCIKCSFCGLFFSPNKFIFHSHRVGPQSKYVQPDAANFNSWRRHMKLSGSPPEEVVHAWEDVKLVMIHQNRAPEATAGGVAAQAMFNGGTRKRLLASAASASNQYFEQNVVEERGTGVAGAIARPAAAPHPSVLGVGGRGGGGCGGGGGHAPAGAGRVPAPPRHSAPTRRRPPRPPAAGRPSPAPGLAAPPAATRRFRPCFPGGSVRPRPRPRPPARVPAPRTRPPPARPPAPGAAAAATTRTGP